MRLLGIRFFRLVCFPRMMNNLLANIPTALTEEIVQVLVESPGVRIERIVSRGQTTARGNWYDQPDQEWVLLLQAQRGCALPIKTNQSRWGPATMSTFQPTASIGSNGPANQPTIWLAIHFSAMADR